MSKALRLAAIILAVGLGAAAPVARLEPGRLAGFTDLYVPDARGRDYELYMAAYQGEAVRSKLVVRRRGDWARVERGEGEAVDVQQIHIPTGLIVERTDKAVGGVDTLSIRTPDSAPTPGIDYAARRTDRSWNAAGQKCRIWEVYRGVDAGYTTFTRFSCVTRDGIEVARWTTGRTGQGFGDRVQGYHLLRRRLKDEDVRPQAASLDIAAWLATPPATAASPNDYEVVLKAEGATQSMTVRRRGGWTLTETVNADGSRDVFSDREDGVSVSARVGPTGAPESYTARRGAKPEALAVVRLETPSQTVLGQTCEWFDAMPYVADAGRHECRTADGLVLIIRKSAWGEQTTFTATAVSRRPLTTADLLPPAWMLDLTRWGVRD